jgi:protein SCO1/2
MWVAACSDGIKSELSAIDVTGAEYGKDFRLQDTSGQWRTLADYRGKVVMLFFGFTQCPDVCPAAMMQAVEVLKLLGDDAGKVQVLFVSLDPERDTPEILRAYIQNFHPSFQALRGDVELTRTMAEAFKVFYRKAPFAGSYTIEHTALVYLYDTQGQLRRALRPGITASTQADAVRALTRG